MYNISFKIVGDAPLIMHSDLLSDPYLDCSAKSKAITDRKMTKADHEELANIQFAACCYTDDLDRNADHMDSQIVYPSANVEACIINGAKVSREKWKTEASFYINSETVEFTYGWQVQKDSTGGDSLIKYPVDDTKNNTPRKLMKVAKNAYVDRRGVVIQKNRVPMVRPVFPYWMIEVNDLILDDTMISVTSLKKHIEKAGHFSGLGDYRPRFGRFTVVEFNAVEL